MFSFVPSALECVLLHITSNKVYKINIEYKPCPTAQRAHGLIYYRNKLNDEILRLTQESHTSVVTADIQAVIHTSYDIYTNKYS